MVCGIVNNTIALVNESFSAAVLGGVFDIGFAVRTFWQCFVIIACIGSIIVEFVAANHHADGCPRVEIPLFKSLAGFGFVKILAFIFANVVRGQFVELAQVCGYGIAGGVFAGFLNCFVDAFDFDRRRTRYTTRRVCLCAGRTFCLAA